MQINLKRLREAGAKGLIADVTSRLGGECIELDYPGRGPRESKLELLKIGEIKNCLPPKEIREGDTILIFKPSGEVVYTGTLTSDGRLRHKDGSKSVLSVAAYCARWRTAAGIKVLRKPWWKYTYTKRECMVPMRDGKHLYTAVYEPEGLSGRPIILQRSPYPCNPFGTGGPGDIRDNFRMYADNGYIIVYQNVRGTYLSEGEFEDVRPVGGPVDEVSDSYDTIEWLLANTQNNGRVGIYGISYPGFYATLASLCGHPALKAVSPQAPVTDWWMGDDAHRRGAFSLADMYGFVGFFFLPKLNPTPDSRESITKVPEDQSIYEFFKGKSMRQVWDDFGDALPFMNAIKEHPDYDDFWKERNPLRHLRNIKPAILVVGGLYDAEDTWGTLHTYKAYKEAGADCRFVYGPWTHGGWKKVDYYLEEIEYPFFAYYLEDKDSLPEWRELWMPTGVSEPGPMEDGFKMIEDPVLGEMKTFPIAPGTYISDPFEPVPYMESDAPKREKPYMWAPQNFASQRPDVLCRIVQEPLKEALLAIGPVKVHLKAQVSGSDADFIVKLIDVAPDGTQTLVRLEVMPARRRHGMEHPVPLEPGKPFELDFTMMDICHRFATEHSIMVQVQSSCFPLVAMNPQTFIKNQYTAEQKNYRAIEVSILEGSSLSVFTD